MRIQHNIMAMNAYRNYTNNVASMKKNLEKLSSGYKINRAGDDAAGLAISEKMRAQITGLQTAQKNAKDGISLVQTAEGAMTEVHDMLNRMVELATQSANGTYDNDVDRNQMQKEVDQLLSEIDRIADSSNFNGINLLDGTLGMNKEAFVIGGDVAATSAQLIENGAKISDTVFNGNASAAAAARATKTVLHTSGQEATAGTFTIDLSELAIECKSAGSFKLKIGGAEVATIALTKGAKLTATGIAAKIMSKIEGATDTKALGIDKNGAVKVGDAAKGTGAILFKATNNGDGTITFTTNKVSVKGTGWTSLTDGKLTADVAANAANKGLGMAVEISAAAANFDVAGGVNLNNIKTTNIVQGAKPSTTQLASTIVTLDPTKIEDGTKLTIGDKTITFAIGKNSAVDTTQAGVVDLTKGSFANLTKLSEVATADQAKVMAMITAAYGNDENAQFTVGNDGTWNKLTVWERGNKNGDGTSNITDADTLKALETKEGFQKLIKLEKPGQEAGVEFSIVADKLKDGNVLNINGKKFMFAGKDSTAVLPKDATKIEYDGKTADQLITELNNNGAGIKKTADGKYYVSGVDGKPAKILGKGLTLQIGDTSDSFNQLNVEVQNMHVGDLGIKKLNISTEEAAQTAIQKIKDAINTVSDVRGTLGATQNRLDHTINNLSVMTENIQDAESTIRDTDVAEEMMAYTKNNILIQSAQAMLAQANQVPQGVLQLLQ